MSGQKEYRSFCEEHDVPLMLQPRWLDAVAPEHWEGVVCGDTLSGQIAMPIVHRKKAWMEKWVTAPFSGHGGPFLTRLTKETEHGKTAERYARVKVLAQTMAQNGWIDVKLSAGDADVQPWLWKGYEAQPFYTHVLTLEGEWKKNYNRTVRKELNRQSKKEAPGVLVQGTWAEASAFCEENHSYWTTEIAGCLDRLLEANVGLKIWLWKVEESLESLVFVVLDGDVLYLLTSAVQENSTEKMAFYLMMDAVFETYKEEVKTVDFMGSADAQLVHTFRALGGRPRLMFRVIKNEPRWVKWMQ